MKLNPDVFIHAAEIADSNEHYFGACNALHAACTVRGLNCTPYWELLVEVYRPEPPLTAYWFGPVRIFEDDEVIVQETNKHRAMSLLFLAEMVREENHDNKQRDGDVDSSSA